MLKFADRGPGGKRRRGFTLIELLVALAILTMVFAIVGSTFYMAIRGWERGTNMLDGLRHGDFVMEQLVSALRSAAFFNSAPSKYGFRLKSSGQADEISWVTSSVAFLPPGSPWLNALHRIDFTIKDNEDGDLSVAIRAYSQFLEEDEADKVEPWFVSSEIKGFTCRVYNFETETWDSEWENTNSLPSLLEITLLMEPGEKYGEPIKLQRLVEIPIATAVTNSIRGSSTGGSTQTNAPAKQVSGS